MTADRVRGPSRRIPSISLVALLLAVGCGEIDGEGPGPGDSTTVVATTSTGVAATSTTAPDATSTTLADPKAAAAAFGVAKINDGLTVAFVFADDGSYRLEAVEQESVVAYDSADLRLTVTYPGSRVRRDGIPPGGPDPDSGSFEYFGRWLMAIGADRAETSGSRSVEHRGRPAVAWEAEFDLGWRPTERYEVVSDVETRLPLLVRLDRAPSERDPDGQSFVWEIVELTVGPVSRALFTQDLDYVAAPGSDQTFEHIDLDRIGDLPGGPRPLPSWLPEGFSLSSVVYADAPRWGAFPDSQAVLVATYRNGVRSISVTSRLNDPTYDDWDPFHPYAEGNDFGEVYDVSFGGGRFRVRDAGWESFPHAWGVIGDLIVTVDGDVSSADLRRVLASLE